MRTPNLSENGRAYNSPFVPKFFTDANWASPNFDKSRLLLLASPFKSSAAWRPTNVSILFVPVKTRSGIFPEEKTFAGGLSLVEWISSSVMFGYFFLTGSAMNDLKSSSVRAAPNWYIVKVTGTAGVACIAGAGVAGAAVVPDASF